VIIFELLRANPLSTEPRHALCFLSLLRAPSFFILLCSADPCCVAVRENYFTVKFRLRVVRFETDDAARARYSANNQSTPL
jgi:hypothetical protein